MRVLFILPAPVRVPIGGVAIVYRHAEGLAERGHSVTVAAPRTMGGARGLGRSAVVWARDRIHGVSGRAEYESHGVRTVECARPADLPTASFDAVIATGFQTARWASTAAERGGARGFYFIQHDERHLNPRAGETWELPLVKITAARWVAEVIREAGQPVAEVIPYAIDPAEFGVDEPVAQRRAHAVALYHRLPSKGPDVLIAALRALRKRSPSVGATVIAARPPSHRFPAWVDVRVRPPTPELRAIYNGAAVCLHTSRSEGWGLVPMEAAACGCAVVATASGGPAEYLTAGRSMVEVPVGSSAGLAEAAARLIDHEEERVRLAEAAVHDVGRFSWEASQDAFERVLLTHLP